jgi:hypothetical protein
MTFFEWLQSTPVALAIRDSVWMYPAFESLHYIGLALLVGGIMLIDLRVLGFARGLPLKPVLGLLPWVFAGFFINVVTGSLLFTYGATQFGSNTAFWVKMTLIVLAGINALMFEITTRRARRAGVDWVLEDRPPALVKGFATASFVLWLGVVTTGRWMAYV